MVGYSAVKAVLPVTQKPQSPPSAQFEQIGMMEHINSIEFDAILLPQEREKIEDIIEEKTVDILTVTHVKNGKEYKTKARIEGIWGNKIIFTPL